MTQVIKVSKQGISVGTATNPNDFIFDSTLNTFKIIAQGTYSPTLGTTSDGTASVAHGQANIPFVIPYCRFANGSVSMPGNHDNTGFYFTGVLVGGTNIDFLYINTTGGNYTPIFKYIIVEPTF